MFSRVALVFLLVLAGAVATARAFVPTGFPDQSEVAAGLVYRWADYLDDPGHPFVMTYSVSPTFLSNQDPEVVAGAMQAIEDALRTWSEATRGLITFEQAPWDPVMNGGTQQGQEPPHSRFVGPPQDEYIACVLDCSAQCGGNTPCIQNCVLANCTPSGLGAHIDFFSQPSGFTRWFGNVQYTMQTCNLGFTALRLEGADEIVSSDIYINSDWHFTVDASKADATKSLLVVGDADEESGPVMCTHGVDPNDPHGHAEAADRTDCTDQQNTLTIDLQTVLLHEIGHALGLEHPNDLPQHAGGVNLSPWTFASGYQRTNHEVMYGGYQGVKRQLTDDEIGGMAFLYPPALYGDIDADGRVSFLDAFAALDIFEGHVPADPWSVNRLDFNTRNGKIDMDEIQQMLLWVVDPTNHPPGVVPSQNPSGWDTGVSGPTSITIGGSADPSDIGVGGTVDVALTIDNPDSRTVQGWDLRMRYNSDVLTNPRYGTGRDFLTGSSLIPMTITPVSPGLSEVRIGSLGFDQDASTAGTIATVRFDIDLVAAAAVSAVTFTFNGVDSEIVVALPYSHSFSKDQNFPDETLTLNDITADAYLLDVDENGVVDLNDLYAYTVSPVDVNYDSMITGYDQAVLSSILRAGEMQDVAGRYSGNGGQSLESVEVPMPDVWRTPTIGRELP